MENVHAQAQVNQSIENGTSFDLILLRPMNNFSVIKGRLFLG